MTEHDAQLRDVIERSRDTVLKQHARILQLTGEPFALGTVLRIGKGVLLNPTPKDFAPSVRVFVRPGAELESSKMGLGTIKNSLRPGWVTVHFDSGAEGEYRIGETRNDDPLLVLGECDLELFDRGISVVVAYEGRELEVKLPVDKSLKAGDTVRLSMKTFQIVDVIEDSLWGGVATIKRILDNGRVEVEFQGNARVVLLGRTQSPEAGDRVVLDKSGSIILLNIGKDESRFEFSEKLEFTWADIGGQDAAVSVMIQAIEFPIVHADLYKKYKRKPLKGILIYGPPGCGKTLLAKGAAAARARLLSSKDVSGGFLCIKGPEMLTKWVGEPEGVIRQIFDLARAFKKKYGYPLTIFIDEAEALLSKRGSGISSDVEKTIVPTFLAEMDGLEESSALIILATNRPDVLDPAIIRPGRIDRKVKVDRPRNQKGAGQIFAIHLKKTLLREGLELAGLAAQAATEVFSPKRVIFDLELTDNAGQKEDRPFTFGDVLSGAMIANIVERATEIAIRRNVENLGTPEGITFDDIVSAADSAFVESRDGNYDDDFQILVEESKKTLTKCLKASTVQPAA